MSAVSKRGALPRTPPRAVALGTISLRGLGEEGATRAWQPLSSPPFTQTPKRSGIKGAMAPLRVQGSALALLTSVMH